MAIKMDGTIEAILLTKDHFKRVINFVDNDGFIAGANGFDSLAIHD